LNTIDVSYENEDMAMHAPEAVVVAYLNKTFNELGIDGVEASCSFVSDETIRNLNLKYREKDESTDILSFPQQSEDDFFPISSDDEIGEDDQGPQILGDMVISLESMQRNCEAFEVDQEEELLRLLIHGALHLLGEDHDTNEVAEPMLQQQERLLNVLRKEPRN
jgi:probable rRNA maturation factor